MVRVLEREDRFNPPIEVAGHPVGAAGKDVWLVTTAVFEVEDTAVFQIASKNTAHSDVFADAFDVWH